MQRKITLIIIIILILTLSILGITYAFMRPQEEQKEEKSNITINACSKVQLKDNGSSINLENTYPMEDDMGLKTEPYEFIITSTCDDYVGFNLYLTSLSDNEIEDNNIHFAITSKDNTVLVSNILSKATNALSEFNNEELQELDKGIKGNHKNIYKVYSNNIPLKGESNYKLYLWVDKDVSNETMSKSFKVGLSIMSYNREKTIADACLGKTAECITENANLDSTLYFHNAELEGGAQDESYRYAGASDDVKNFVCLDGNVTTEEACANDDADLYRIIGIFKNEEDQYEIKLIKYDYATSKQLGTEGAYKATYSEDSSNYKGNKNNLLSIGSYYWTSSSNEVNEWAGSELRETNLNEYYLNTYLKEMRHIDVDNLITTHTWSLNGHNYIKGATPKMIYDNEMDKVESNPSYPTKTKTIENKIGLMYVSDYGYAGSPSSTNNWTKVMNLYSTYTPNNWMYMGLREWTISRDSADSYNTLVIGFNGNLTSDGSSVYNHGYGIRPSFYLTFDAKISEGEGSKTNPYRITL